MVLEFLCPNGHRIHCPEDRAGRAAKCPKCGVKFQIPDVSDADAGGSGPSLPALSDSNPMISIAGTQPRLGGDEEIEFLCPNGHLLHGPASMQGRPGQCPDCGAKFRVPSYDEEEADVPQADQAEYPTRPAGKPESEVIVEGAEEQQKDVQLPPPAEQGDTSGRVSTARLFARLWNEREQGASVELRLGDGHAFTPEYFVERLSSGTHGLFGVREPDGSYTLVAIAWTEVIRVVVRGVRRLPDEVDL